MTEEAEELPSNIEDEEHREIPKIPVVGVGASEGGLDAFKNLFQSMPNDTGIAFVLVQHLDPTHESMIPRSDIDMRRMPQPFDSSDIPVVTHHQQGDYMIFQNAIQTK